jgi:hypothetical protein
MHVLGGKLATATNAPKYRLGPAPPPPPRFPSQPLPKGDVTAMVFEVMHSMISLADENGEHHETAMKGEKVKFGTHHDVQRMVDVGAVKLVQS